MVHLPLFRRQQIWLPTLWGWLVLLLAAGAACVFAGRYIHTFLSPNVPVPQAKILVVEGWLTGEELDEAVAAFRSGRYERVVTTGGPIEKWLNFRGSSSYADWAADYLKTHGLANTVVTPVSAPASTQDRTYLSAVMVRDWAARQGLALNALNVFSANIHARRSWMLYRKAFGPNVEVGVLSARPVEYDERHWWRTSAGTKSVLGEAISVLWTVCCFHVPPSGSQEVKLGEPSPTERQ